jgi:tRNA (cmo5U34)-methyltransferase
MATVTVVRIDHVQLAMPKGEEAAARRFYTGLLGMPEVEKPSDLAVRGGCWFEMGTLKIHLGVDPEFRPARKAHPALVVDDLASLVARLSDAGVPIVEEPMDGHRRVYAEDPFGNRLEFIEPLPAGVGTENAAVADREHGEEQFHFDPATYAEIVRREVPDYDRFQQAIVDATEGIEAHRILDLGSGTGVTAAMVSAAHPAASLVGVDANPRMLEHAARAVPTGDFRVGRLEEELPAGPFELVVSALAVHHLDATDKLRLFRRVAGVLAPGGRFVLGDVVVPEEPRDAVTPVHPDHDRPSSAADQAQWLRSVGLAVHTAWGDGDLVVLACDLPSDE